jgi:putative addiction module CopG family antidote
MNVSLSDELERFVHRCVVRGYYKSASEVVRDALRLLKESIREREANRAMAETRLRELQHKVYNEAPLNRDQEALERSIGLSPRPQDGDVNSRRHEEVKSSLTSGPKGDKAQKM